jgi:dUTPase
MPYQLGDRDLALFTQVSKGIAKVKEEVRERDENQTMRSEDKRSKMVESLEKMKKYYKSNVLPEIPRVRERKQMVKEDMKANLIREAEKIKLEKQRLLVEAERDLKNRKGMIDEDYLGKMKRLSEEKTDKEINGKILTFMEQTEKIDSKDPDGEGKLLRLALQHKNFLDNVLRDNKMSPPMREKIHKFMHGLFKDFLFEKHITVIDQKYKK